MRLVVGITGATGAIYGIRLLESLKALGVESHLVMSDWAERTIRLETGYTVDQVRALATVCHDEANQAATISSGSFRTAGMVIAPCSMKSLAGIAHGYGDNLIQRAADVTLKERRRLVLLAREMPLNSIHLENMLKLSNMGAVILPPVPAFYNHPVTLDDVINHVVARTLDLFEIDNDLTVRWGQKSGHGRAEAVGAD